MLLICTSWMVVSGRDRAVVMLYIICGRNVIADGDGSVSTSRKIKTAGENHTNTLGYSK